MAAISCGSQKPLVETKTVTERITETVHDTVFKVEADSSYYEAYIKCINNKPVLVEPLRSESKSNPGKLLMEPKVILKDTIITVECETKAQELFAQWKSTYKATTIEIEKPVPVPAQLSYYQKTMIKLGWLLLLALLVAVGYLGYKNKTKILTLIKKLITNGRG